MVHLRTLFGALSDLENIQFSSMLDALTLRKCVCLIFINYLDALSIYTSNRRYWNKSPVFFDRRICTYVYMYVCVYARISLEL